MSESVFDRFLREARERPAAPAAPAAPSYAERLHAILEETRDPRDERRDKIRALAAEGATEGERSAARAALHRFDNTPSHDEANRMQRGGNFAGDE